MKKAINLIKGYKKQYPELNFEMEYSKITNSGIIEVGKKNETIVSEKYGFEWSFSEQKFIFYNYFTGIRIEKLYKELRKIIKDDSEYKKEKTKQNDLTYKEWLNQSKIINDEVDKMSLEVDGVTNYLKGGLLPNEIRLSEKYKIAKQNFNISFKRLQDFNKSSPKSYMKQKSKDFRFKNIKKGV